VISEEDKEFLSYVKAHKHIGYGRMMQIISHEWYQEHGEGAFVSNTCFAFLSDAEQRAFLEVLAREEQQGMRY